VLGAFKRKSQIHLVREFTRRLVFAASRSLTALDAASNAFFVDMTALGTGTVPTMFFDHTVNLFAAGALIRGSAKHV
jgi:hypothetical protein